MDVELGKGCKEMQTVRRIRALAAILVAAVPIDVIELLSPQWSLGEEWRAITQVRNPYSLLPIVVSSLWALAVGILAVGLYVVARPRFRWGVTAATGAGFLAWVLVWLAPGLLPLLLGVVPVRLLLVGLVLGLMEIVPAALLGAWCYGTAPAPWPAEPARDLPSTDSPVCYASIGRRLLAWSMDAPLTIFLGLVIVWAPLRLTTLWGWLPLSSKGSVTFWDDFSAMQAVAGVLFLITVAAVVPAIYWAGMESSLRQGTIGKWALGIAVTDREGRRITFRQAALRFFAKWLSHVVWPIGLLSLLTASLSPKRLALHDLLASTCVVRKVG